MKKIRFADHVLPHLIAIAVFLIITVFFFSPVFFESKAPVQHDIQMYQGSAKAIIDYREKTGEEALWTNSMFSGMPAYLISVEWSNKPIILFKQILTIGIPHPIANIFAAFVSYYIMLLCFGVRPSLAIAGAIAFGLSSYIIIGLSAGHNGRVGAIAFMPLVIAGIHLAFSNLKLLGAAVTAVGMALHLRENHLQITYYLLLIVLIYGLIRLIEAIRTKTLPDFTKTIALLLVSTIMGAGTFFGQFWAITEYSSYSTRGKSDLAGLTPAQNTEASLGMSRAYAFEFSNGIAEPLTLLIPNVYGGSSGNFLISDQKSHVYNALVSSGNQKTANQLASYTSAYWGDQRMSAPYYAGAIIVFLFAVGIAFAEKKYIWWLTSAAVLGIVLTWGSNFAALNYFLFDYLPGYNKFRSVTFAIFLPLFAMPLLGMLGLESLWKKSADKDSKRKLLYAFAGTGGLCLLLWLIPGFFSFLKDSELTLPAWFTDALAADRKDLLRSDAFRSFAFIFAIFILLYFNVHKKISPIGFYAFLIIMITIDLAVVDKRFLTKESFKRKRESSFVLNESDQAILADKSYYRVYNLGDNPFTEARTSYFHNSVGGYHGAKLRRYADFYDSCVVDQTQQFITRANQGNVSFEGLHGLNMLNVKYIVFGPNRNNVIPNADAFGNAWFVSDVQKVNSAAEELAATCNTNTRVTAVVDASQFPVSDMSSDSTGTIKLIEQNPKYLKYESLSTRPAFAVFSEIYYPKGWIATIDGQEKDIIRTNYILRGLEVPEGKHTIEFRFEPKAYTVGNKVTMAFSWLVFISLVVSVVVILKEEKKEL